MIKNKVVVLTKDLSGNSLMVMRMHIDIAGTEGSIFFGHAKQGPYQSGGGRTVYLATSRPVSDETKAWLVENCRQRPQNLDK